MACVSTSEEGVCQCPLGVVQTYDFLFDGVFADQMIDGDGLMLSDSVGAVGGLLGMRRFRHKTKHWYFKLGLPALLVVQIVLLALTLPSTVPYWLAAAGSVGSDAAVGKAGGYPQTLCACGL